MFVVLETVIGFEALVSMHTCADYIFGNTMWLFTFCDIVQNNVASVAENTALQCGAMQVEAVHVFLSCIIVKYGQITRNYKKKRGDKSELDARKEDTIKNKAA